MMTKPRFRSWFKAEVSEADFEALYNEHLPRIYNYFRYRLGDGPLAEDLTAATFEKAWRSRERYRRDLGAFSTWLFTIARRVAVDHYRRRRPQTSLEDQAHLSVDENLEERVQQQADIQKLSVLLARLADRERELVALKYGAGLTNRAIAGLSGLSESNVGVILHRALQSLRTDWETEA
jgi:RNA polymerase sigma-70 factor (ECF subfamily)